MMKAKQLSHWWPAILSFVAITAVLLISGEATASDVGIRAGYYFNANAASFGMEMLTPMNGMEGQWYFNPNFDLALGDDNLAAFNFDFHYDFPTESKAAVWAGAGPALLIVDHNSRFSDNTDVNAGLDLVVGIGAKTGTYRPYVQGKGVLSSNSEAALSVGIRF